MEIALRDGGTITMEFPHLLKLIELNQWDTIYHEHYSYLSFRTVERIFEAHGLRLFDVQELPTHGGSLRIFGCHAGDERERSDAARELLERERAAGLGDLRTYLDYGERVVADKRQILSFLIDLKARWAVDRRLRRAGEGQHAAELLRRRARLPRLHVRRQPAQAGQRPAGHAHPDPGAGRDRASIARTSCSSCPGTSRTRSWASSRYIREWGGRFAARDPELRLFG